MSATKSIYGQLIVFEEVGGNMTERIRSIGAFETFEPLIKFYVECPKPNLERFNQALFYILHLYSRQSEILNTSGDIGRPELKAIVLNKLRIDDKKFRNELINLDVEAVRETADRYMDTQGSKRFQHLMMLHDQYSTMLVSARYVVGKDGIGLDYDQMRKNSKYAAELYEEINKWEQEVEEEEKILTLGKNEVIKRSGNKKAKRFSSLRMEDIQRQVREEYEKNATDNEQENTGHDDID